MTLTGIHDKEQLPSDPAQLREVLWSLLQEYRLLNEQNQLLRKELFGRKSERIEHDAEQQTLLDELLGRNRS